MFSFFHAVTLNTFLTFVDDKQNSQQFAGHCAHDDKQSQFSNLESQFPKSRIVSSPDASYRGHSIKNEEIVVKHIKNSWLAGLLIGVFSLTPAANASGTYPDRSIRLIVGTAPGTGGDTVTRIVGEGISQRIGQSVVVENRTGAGGSIAMEAGAAAAPDGYTLTVGTSSTLITNPALNPSVKYRLEKNFMPIASMAETAFVIVTANNDTSPKTLVELLDRLASGNGTFGSLGAGTIGHLSSELLLKQAGRTALHIPYKTTGLIDISSGEVLFGSDTAAAVMPLIKAGKLRPLAVTTEKRLASLPDTPTVAESSTANYKLQSYKATAWWGIFAPTGTPESVIAKISDATVGALNEASVQTKLRDMSLEPLVLDTAAFNALVKKELPALTQFVNELGLVKK